MGLAVSGLLTGKEKNQNCWKSKVQEKVLVSNPYGKHE